MYSIRTQSMHSQTDKCWHQNEFLPSYENLLSMRLNYSYAFPLCKGICVIFENQLSFKMLATVLA